MFLANTELLNLVQTRFYNPSVLKSYEKENAIDADIIQNHIFELQNKFADTLTEGAVRSSFLYSQSAGDIYERSRIFGILLESTGGLQSVQFVDSNGVRIHYSTSSRDIISQSQNTTAYRNYNEDPTALPYETVSVSANASPKFIMDEQNGRIIFAYPFIDSMEVYRGTAVFTVSARALAERLIAEGRLKVNDDVSVIGQPPGILLGSPESSRADIIKKTAEIWKEGTQGRTALDSEESGVKFSLISLKTVRGIFFGRLINDKLFSVSDSMKLLLQLSIFLTFFLTVFFMINFKPSPATIVRNRIRRLRENIFEELYENKTDNDKTKWILELEQRRDEIRSELKRRIRLTRRNEKNIDAIIDRAWDEVLAIVKAGSGYVSLVPPETHAVQHEEQKAPVYETEEIEEVQAIYEAEEVEEIEEVEGIEAVEEAEPHHKGLLELASEIEELDEDIEEAEEIKPHSHHKGLLELAEEIEELEDIEEAEPHRKGLLELADEVEVEEIEELIEELEEIKEIKIAMPPAHGGKGLLALASKEKSSDTEPEEEETAPSRKGLLALAREIEFSQPSVAKEEEEDLDADLDIVSPFSSMFQSLDEKPKKKPSAKTKKKKST
jgi:hypothetical protein